MRPRKNRGKIESQLLSFLEKNEYENAVQLSLSHYTNKETADAFTISLFATAEAIINAKEIKWSKSVEELTTESIENVELKLKLHTPRFLKNVIFDLVSNSLREEYSKEGSKD